ncbi:hypothetical protein POX_d05871 [Penicillium oxalicum]|uniref:hypothetical protein n=1 Tax=Penicillium oxalicum TaxID=69781 RepID=UPI0020B88CF9|nr:hypothetical protein POX_d05871 [Penicillium oxalicum]KAI2790360.1 hypothetical protein POX_d05871 [Penicillium oxalicum]
MPSPRSNETPSAGRTEEATESGNRPPSTPDQASDGNQASAEMLNSYRSNTDRLLEFLSRSNDESLDRLFALVRAGASHEAVFDAVDRLSPNERPHGQRRNQPNGTNH